MYTLNTQTIGQGPDLVLLHGWGFHSGVWQPFLPLLSDDFRITTIDLPGYGDSKTNQDTLTLEHLTNSVLAAAPKKAAYLGWSLGGLIVTQIAKAHPNRITQLITIASTPKFLAEENWFGMASETLEKFAETLKTDSKTLLKQFIALQFQGTQVNRSTLTTLKETISKTPLPEEKTLNDGLAILKHTDLRETLKNIQCPQLYLYGRCDCIVPVEVTEKIKLISPNAQTHIIPKAGHAPFLSHPEACLKPLKAFLK